MSPSRPPQPTDALVAAQGVALAGLLWPGPARWSLPWPVRAAAVLGLATGTGLLAAGVSALGKDLTAFVEPRPDAPLRTDGVYAVSRNPIYAGLLVASGALAVLRRRPEPLVAAGVLSAVLHVKTGVEERHLLRRYGNEYAEYSRRVPRLIGRVRPERYQGEAP